MIVSGIQKLSLLDYPGKVACTVFTPGCNFRCPFCHNSSLVTGKAPVWDIEEVKAFLTQRRKLLDAVTVSGGEPLLQPDIAEFLRFLKDIGYSVKLDTNGTNPDALLRLIRDGLVDYVAMDLKNRPEKYDASAGIKVDANAVKASADLLKSGIVESEFRTTVVKPLHQKGDIAALTAYYRPHKYFLQGFIDSGDILLSDGLGAYNRDEMEAFLTEAKQFCINSELRGV